MPRILVALTTEGGDVDVVNIGRPANLVAFGDEFGKTAPGTYREIAWLAHRQLAPEGVELDAWLETLEDLDASGPAVAAAERKLRGRLEPHEALSELSGPELVDLAAEPPTDDELASVDAGDNGDRPRSRLDVLIVQARRHLEQQAAELERDHAAASHNAAVDREKAQQRLASMTEAELEALPVDELQRLQVAAGAEVPTMVEPATIGGNE